LLTFGCPIDHTSNLAFAADVDADQTFYV